LRDGLAAERVGLDDVGAGLEVLAMDVEDHVGPRQHEQVVVALQLAAVVREARAAEVTFLQLAPLDHRPHRAVQDQDALAGGMFELIESIGHEYLSICSCRLSAGGRQPSLTTR
jgi:hypothetical protein